MEMPKTCCGSSRFFWRRCRVVRGLPRLKRAIRAVIVAVPLALVLLFLCVTLAAQDKQEKKEEPQRPTFRSGAHYVRVDAYPTADGKPIPGLTAADFEILEDGKPQTIDRLEYIEFPEFTPLTDRRDPNSQRDAYALAR